ncbi:hypothetical protein M407DRAFT_240896 [Tulasnella calospora MUT 4182]|uniref:Uncharacterized protein n=1 Tax=Tulasnella calospora MUT 4182 TaxID=1051891 RepID=A0A0C3LI85_9AGAM|nr:hypothetical protein M407DRAFT_240896 [Tulasnella calospora MUT 4182]
MISWTVDQDGCLQSYSSIDQTQYQNQFYTSSRDIGSSVIQVCLLPGLNKWGIGDDQVFTMKLEPV